LDNELPVTRKELDDCIAVHRHALVSLIRFENQPLSGGILTMLKTLDRLQAIVPTKADEPVATLEAA
jgi:hypothetical protein